MLAAAFKIFPASLVAIPAGFSASSLINLSPPEIVCIAPVVTSLTSLNVSPVVVVNSLTVSKIEVPPPPPLAVVPVSFFEKINHPKNRAPPAIKIFCPVNSEFFAIFFRSTDGKLNEFFGLCAQTLR